MTGVLLSKFSAGLVAVNAHMLVFNLLYLINLVTVLQLRSA